MKHYNVSNIELECSCISISQHKWNILMEGSVKANGSIIRKLIKKFLPELYNNLALDYYNPYESQSVRTKTHYVYVHSGIEYFIKKKD